MLDSIYTALSQNNRLSTIIPRHRIPQLIARGILRPVKTGDPVLAQGSKPGHVFIVLSGQISIRLQDEAGEAVLDVLREGSIFGNFPYSAAYADVRRATADFPSVLLEVPRELIDDVFSDFPRLHETYLRRFGKRILLNTLKSVPVLHAVPEVNLNSLVSKAHLKNYARGDTIVTEGEPGEAFYVIHHGIATVRHLIEDTSINLAQLGPGDYFGEWSLLTGAPRAATVTALTLMTLASVTGEVFLDFIQQNPDVRDSIDLVAQRRHEEALTMIGRLESASEVDARISELHKILS